MAMPVPDYVKDSQDLSMESEAFQQLFQELQNLREFNRVVLDVFWSASKLVKKCCEEGNCKQSYTILVGLLKSLESELKENAV